MIKLTFCLTRLANLSRDGFQDYWFRQHAPLVARHRKALRIERYVQLHSGEPGMSEEIRKSRGAPEQYDGVAQLWWQSFDDLAAISSDPRATEAGRELLDDERKFIDLAKSPLWFGEEKVIFG